MNSTHFHDKPRALWLRWIVATAAGELLGFAIPAIVGAVSAWLALGQVPMAGALVVAGAGEGAALGLAQWLVLRRAVPALPQRAWVGATAAAAVVAWVLGMLPSTLSEFVTLSIPAIVALAVVLGAVFLCSIGGAQWLVLRRYVPRAGWWVLANAVAWPLGVALPVLGLTLLPDGTAPSVMLAVGLVCGMLMGVVVGAITGAALVRLLYARPARLQIVDSRL